MTMSDNNGAVPAGYEPLPTGLGFTDFLQPSYRRLTGEAVSFGILVQKSHCNIMGICHGGVIMTLADIAAATGVNHACGRQAGSPTINLAVDFINAGKEGDWLQADVAHVSIKRRFGFCNGLLTGPRGVVARFNGTFYLPDHDGIWKQPASDGVEAG
ncbi:PaaI family thioesterase [Kineobactrum sediminis]|nr:PaaI family thioesterase [Kineobactrum sediminis]